MNPLLVVRRQIDAAGNDIGRGCWMWCPGCDTPHRPVIASEGVDVPGPVWTWNGSLDAPTFEPSLLVRGRLRCHSFIRDGRWQFLDDCEHPLAGRTVPMVPVPDWLAWGDT